MSEASVSAANPRWLRDLRRFLPLKSQFVLSSNVRDLHAAEVAPGVVAPQPFDQVLARALQNAGFEVVLRYEPVLGFSNIVLPGADPAAGHSLLASFDLTPMDG